MHHLVRRFRLNHLLRLFIFDDFEKSLSLSPRKSRGKVLLRKWMRDFRTKKKMEDAAGLGSGALSHVNTLARHSSLNFASKNNVASATGDVG